MSDIWGVTGALNGRARSLAFTGRGTRRARVLLCAVELCTLHYHYGWNPSKMIANALFADAGPRRIVGVPA